VRLLFGPGQRHDVTRSHELVDGVTPGAVIADKGYDADHLHQAVRDTGAEAVIPPRSNRKTPRAYDRALYRERNLVEPVECSSPPCMLRELDPAFLERPGPDQGLLRPPAVSAVNGTAQDWEEVRLSAMDSCGVDVGGSGDFADGPAFLDQG